jgi:hypothetical protein
MRRLQVDRNRRCEFNTRMEMPERESEMRVAKRRTPVVLGVICAVLGLIVLGTIAASRARARAEKIQCANILSSLELAARCYSQDYEGTFAPNLQCMSNEISTTRILTCPSDRSRVPATNLTLLNSTNISYVYLAASLQSTNATTNALFRCPIHGHVVYGDGRIVLGDGTVQYGKRLF